VGLTFSTLFVVGAMRALITVSRWWSAGAEMLLLGIVVAAAAYISGSLISTLTRGAP
jgi:VIT1/CCC1 family predicted Fe2+/Mn2+ transporter